ncbi:MAG: hypothetical protein ABSF23_07550 [Terracidiphilus sp.]
MHDIALQSGWETFLLAAPLVGMVLVGIFRLDVIAAAHRPAAKGLPPSATGENGHTLLTDPDRRPWPDPSRSK